MSPDNLFSHLWDQYIKLNPAVEKIHQLFQQRERKVINDHIALRTLQHPKIGIEELSKAFIKQGYQTKGHYTFTQKKLNAIHLEHLNNPDLPLVFISELKLHECSEYLQSTLQHEVVDEIDEALIQSDGFCHSGRSWGEISYTTYEKLREESEYAAWFYVFGYTANHFTVKVNALESFNSLEEVNSFLEAEGYQLNEVAGKIKGTPDLFLEQSSTLAEKRPITFKEGIKEIPSCFYEFARRYQQADGTEFRGFIEGNADKIFESTNMS